MKIVFGFDLDETLIFPNHEKDIKCMYRAINDHVLNDPMIKLYATLKVDHDTFILTARPIECTPQILSMFKVRRVLSASVPVKDIDDLKSLLADPEHEKFIIRKKVKILNDIQEKEKCVIFFFDDKYKMFKKLNKNIYVLPPVIA